MRWIDRRVGVPLTLLLSLLIWIKNKILFIKRRSPDVARTLFIELSEMGSAIIVDPAMRKLQREGSSELFFAIFRDNHKSLKFLNTIPESNIFTLRSNNLFVMGLDVIRFMRWCREKKITAVIDLELFSRFTAILCGLSGAAARIGFVSFHDEGLYRGSIINFGVRYNPHVHMSVNFMSLVRRALNHFTNPYATVEVKKDDLILAKATISNAERETVKHKVKELYPQWNRKDLVLINANASDLLPQRRWQPENFTQVSKMILESWKDVLLIATGSPDERDYVQNVVDQTHSSRFVNSAGVFEFEELVARIEAVCRRCTPYKNGKFVSDGEEAIVSELRTIIKEERILPFFQPAREPPSPSTVRLQPKITSYIKYKIIKIRWKQENQANIK